MALRATGVSSLALRRSKIALTCSQVAGGELQSDGHPIVGRQPAFSNDSISADAIVWREPQPGNKMVFVLPFDHVPTRFAENRSGGHYAAVPPVDVITRPASRRPE
jgi:hypothetical protein